MNRVPEKFILVAADRLQAFTEQKEGFWFWQR